MGSRQAATIDRASATGTAATIVRATATGTAAAIVRVTATGTEAATIVRATVIRIRDRDSASHLALAVLESASAVRTDAKATTVMAARPADLEYGDRRSLAYRLSRTFPLRIVRFILCRVFWITVLR